MTRPRTPSVIPRVARAQVRTSGRLHGSTLRFHVLIAPSIAAPLRPCDRRARGVGLPAMAAVITIVAFVAVIAGLNWYEFGRFD